MHLHSLLRKQKYRLLFSSKRRCRPVLRNEYLVAENRILKARINGRLRLSDGEKATLAEIAKRLGTQSPSGYRSGGQAGHTPGLGSEADRAEVRRLQTARILRPRVDLAVEELVVKLARENSNWG